MKKARSAKVATEQLTIDWDPPPAWPSPQRFPYNDLPTHQHVRTQVWPDLITSPHPRVITGFTSLGVLLEFLAACSASDTVQDIRIVLGHEPTLLSTRHVPTSADQLRQEIAEQSDEELRAVCFFCVFCWLST